MMELIVEGINIPALADDELASRLHNLGFPVGPIVDTTRRVYQLKLAKLLRSEDATGSDSEEAEEKSGSSNSVPTSYLQSEAIGDSPSLRYHNVASASFEKSSSPFRYDELRRKPLPRAGINWNPSPSSLRSSLTADGVHAKASLSPSTTSKPLAFSRSVKIITVACVLLFAVLVYYNMESSATNPVPEFSGP